jgi:hypothetical protein
MGPFINAVLMMVMAATEGRTSPAQEILASEVVSGSNVQSQFRVLCKVTEPGLVPTRLPSKSYDCSIRHFPYLTS